MVCKGRIADSAEKTVGLCNRTSFLICGCWSNVLFARYILVIERCLCQIVYRTKVSPYWGNHLSGSFLIRGQHSNRDSKQRGVMYSFVDAAQFCYGWVVVKKHNFKRKKRTTASNGVVPRVSQVTKKGMPGPKFRRNNYETCWKMLRTVETSPALNDPMI